MTFIARTPLQITGSDGQTQAVAPGEELPDFASWSYVLRQAHLDTGMVEEVGGQNTANLDFSGGYISMGPKFGAVAEVPFAEPPPVAVVAPTAKVAQKRADGGLCCEFCDKVFYRPSRLKGHISKHHA